MTAAVQAAVYPDPDPDPLLAAIVAGHGAPPIVLAPDPFGDFCVNASLFESLTAHPAAAAREREYLGRVLRSQDAARAGGRLAYIIPRRVELGEAEDAAGIGRPRPGSACPHGPSGQGLVTGPARPGRERTVGRRPAGPAL